MSDAHTLTREQSKPPLPPLPPLPWHSVARSLREQGATYDQISAEVEREVSTVRKLLAPKAREQQNAVRARYQRARWARDPEYREKCAERRRALYLADPEYRARQLERNKLRRRLTREERNAKARERYASDDAFREREIARKQARRAASPPPHPNRRIADHVQHEHE